MTLYPPQRYALLGSAPMPAPRERGLNVRRMLRLRGRAMMFLFAAGAILTAAYVFFLTTPEFEASAPIELAASATLPRHEACAEFLGELRSPALLRRALAEPAVKALPGMNETNPALGEIAARISVFPPKGDRVAMAAFHHPDRNTAEAVLRALLSAYSTETASASGDTVQSGALSLRDQAITVRMDQLRKRLESLRAPSDAQDGINAPGEPAVVEAQHAGLAEAERDLTAALAAGRAAEKRIARLEKLQESCKKTPSAAIHAMNIESQVAQDANVIAINRQLAEAQEAWALAARKYVEGAPQLALSRNDREALQTKADQIKAEARAGVIEAMLAQARADAELQKEEAEAVTARRDEYVAQLESHRARQLATALRTAEAEDLEQQIAGLAQDQRVIMAQQLASEASGGGPVLARVLEEVQVPAQPGHGRQIAVVCTGLLLSLFVALLAGLTLEYSDPRIWSAQDIGRVTAAPVFSSLPDSREDRIPANARTATLAESHPGSATVDQVRRAMARILSSGPGKTPLQVCLVTSPGPGDGKTSFACNLAIVLAQAGRSVLLVDLNGNRPGVEPAFGLRPAPGLAELLLNGQVEHDPNRGTGIENLYVLGPGLDYSSLPEHMGAWVMQDFFTGAKRLFNHIIIDCPPVLISSEARVIAPLTDGIVLVVRSGRASFKALEHCMQVFDAVGGNVAGVVVNGVVQSADGNLKRELDLYYGEVRGNA